ncbi:sortase domain-containing protein [Kitasatospora sp. NPDC004240]
MPVPKILAASLTAAALAVVVGCSGAPSGAPSGAGTAERPATSSPSVSAGATTATPTPSLSPATTPTPTASPTTGPAASPSTGPAASPSTGPAAASPSAPDRTAARTEAAVLAIPSIGVSGLKVVPYQGTTDDAAGTRIQDRGVAASPYGEQGGIGPGEVGNYLVTAHRLSAGGPLRELPSVREGDTVVVTLGGTAYEYVITETRSTSFRSPASLAQQRAAVPGRPGAPAVSPMITISTCATPEDNAVGNRWRDANGNPEHRIDKVGMLRATRPATG